MRGVSCTVMPKLINLEHVREGAGPGPCTGWGKGAGALAGVVEVGLARVLYIRRWDQGPLQM